MRFMFFLNSLLILQLLSFINASLYDEPSCQSYAGGSVYPGVYHRSEHNLQTTKAVSMCYFIFLLFICTIWGCVSFIYSSDSQFFIVVSRPAPNFEAQAVINGEFKQLQLSDFRGKYVVFFFYPLDL